jgi:hypothetical protein
MLFICGDLHDWLGVEQQEYCGDPVGQCVDVVGEAGFEHGESLALGEQRHGLCLPEADGDVGAGPVLDRPDKEGSDGVPGGGAVGQPCVDVGLNAGSGGPSRGVLEPGEEFDGFGDLLLALCTGPRVGFPSVDRLLMRRRWCQRAKDSIWRRTSGSSMSSSLLASH